MYRIRLGIAVVALTVAISQAPAQTFNNGIPAGWTCIAKCGTLGADGMVTLAPGGGTQYGFVSTFGGQYGNSLPGVGGAGIATTGSRLSSAMFSANANDLLQFSFNYVTSDGAGFADYAWAQLLDADSNSVAILFTARTQANGSIVPGSSMPAPTAVLTPASVPIIVGAPIWSALGGWGNGKWCYTPNPFTPPGCGYTGWVASSYTIAAPGDYFLEFGVTNWDSTSPYNDALYDSGLAFDGVQLNGVDLGAPPILPPPVTATPEPGSLLLLASGLAGLAGIARRRRQA